ncbi:EAL domain-containing protein [Rugamonas aquatica]|uniref:EAL domain-containing protein n=1 Tax=Rugamonas aquatica TaxID=2743357 RepID=UPI001F1A6266|nr:EAL domain-containing protein [Rugamonas aquatica]
MEFDPPVPAALSHALPSGAGAWQHAAPPIDPPPSYDQCPYFVLTVTLDGRLAALNLYARQHLGAFASGEPAARLYADWAGLVLLETALPAAREHGCWHGELELRGADGSLHPVTQSIELQPATEYLPARLLCLAYDLNHYDVYESLLRFKRLFQDHPQPMWVYDLQTLRFLVVNAAAVAHYGYTEVQFLQMTIRDIRPAEHIPALERNLAAAPLKGTEKAGNWTHVKADGSRIEVQISSHAVTIAGRQARFVVAHDVTGQLRMEAALYASRELKQLVINHIPHQIFWKDLDGKYRGCNAVFAAAAGLTANEEVVGKTDDDFPWRHNAEAIRADDRDIIATGQARLNVEDHLAQRDGSVLWYLVNKLPFHDQRGNIIGVLGTIEDITARKQAEQTLQLRQRALEASDNAVVITAHGPAGELIDYANPAFTRLFGYTGAEAAGRSLDMLLEQQSDDRDALRAALSGVHELTMTLRIVHRDGHLLWARLHVAPVPAVDGPPSHHVCVLTDMTESINYQVQLEHQANHDPLTGLPNRALFGDRMAQAIGYAERYGHHLWVVFIDLDNFKLVNDSLGHQAGDELLCTIGLRLRACLDDSDTVARLGGDEFLLLLSDSPESPASALLQQVQETIAAPMTLAGQMLTVTCSIGVSVYPLDGGEPQQLLKHADIAMYRAKEGGRNRLQFYEAAMHSRISERALIEAELRHALARDELSLHYQPKLDLRTGAVIGMEALLRWQHPAMGMVSPARFIGVAEETGLIVEIGRWVLRSACFQNVAWQQAGLTPLRVAVNVSARQFRDPGLSAEVQAALSDSGLDARYLELELTESLVMHNVEGAVAVVKGLKQMGIALSIDDFGTGYSSLAYLKLFPVDYLKIDQSFVREMLAEPKVAAIVRSVIALGQSLGFRVIAEGVESAPQLAYLRHHLCDEMQGYLFSKPLPPDDFGALLREERSLPLPADETPGEQQTLLMLDDEPAVLAALTRLLRPDGYRLLRAHSAAEAFDLLASHQVQVVVSDQRMAGMNGTEFLSRVKGLYPDTVRIILSGYIDVEGVLNAINRGEIYRFYTKPWDDHALRANIRDAFRYQRMMFGKAQRGAERVHDG